MRTKTQAKPLAPHNLLLRLNFSRRIYILYLKKHIHIFYIRLLASLDKMSFTQRNILGLWLGPVAITDAHIDI